MKTKNSVIKVIPNLKDSNTVTLTLVKDCKVFDIVRDNDTKDNEFKLCVNHYVEHTQTEQRTLHVYREGDEIESITKLTYLGKFQNKFSQQVLFVYIQVVP